MDILPNTYSIGNFEEVLNKALSSNMPFTDQEFLPIPERLAYLKKMFT